MTNPHSTEIEAAVFRRLVAHLNERKDTQNIDLMILAGFCRNCLSKWYKTAAHDLGQDIDINNAQQQIYGMPYDEWKSKHQKPATAQQLAALEAATPQSKEQ